MTISTILTLLSVAGPVLGYLLRHIDFLGLHKSGPAPVPSPGPVPGPGPSPGPTPSAPSDLLSRLIALEQLVAGKLLPLLQSSPAGQSVPWLTIIDQVEKALLGGSTPSPLDQPAPAPSAVTPARPRPLLDLLGRLLGGLQQQPAGALPAQKAA